MLRGHQIVQLRRSLVALLAGAIVTIASGNLLFSRTYVAPSDDQATIDSVDVAGRLDSNAFTEPEAVRPAPEPITISLTLDQTQSAASYLQEAGVDPQAAARWQAQFAEAAQTKTFVKGHTLTLLRDPETGDLRGFRYNLDDRIVVSEQTYGNGVFRSSEELIRYILRPVAVSFRVRSNFRTEAGRHDLPRPIVDTLNYAFQDYRPLSSLPRGSSIKLIYQERVSRDGTTHFATGIQAASISFGGKTLTAFAFRDENGEARLYDANGVALGPQSLRFPLNFQYISSGFSFHRYHPILHVYREHNGIDLAARYGTPVKAVADGQIEQAGWCGGLGRCVRIRHDGGIVSIYGHLSRITPGLEEGSSVRVGEVIGAVGSSGLSTGPHLHYAIEKDGEYVNPLYQDLGERHKVSPRLRALFDRFKQGYLAALDRLPLGHSTAPVEAAIDTPEPVARKVIPANGVRSIVHDAPIPHEHLQRTAEVIDGHASVLR
jgi:murein DD-endopeptidase MepM/ murein hydrolase activator NlpD